MTNTGSNINASSHWTLMLYSQRVDLPLKNRGLMISKLHMNCIFTTKVFYADLERELPYGWIIVFIVQLVSFLSTWKTKLWEGCLMNTEPLYTVNTQWLLRNYFYSPLQHLLKQIVKSTLIKWMSHPITNNAPFSCSHIDPMSTHNLCFLSSQTTFKASFTCF